MKHSPVVEDSIEDFFASENKRDKVKTEEAKDVIDKYEDLLNDYQKFLHSLAYEFKQYADKDPDHPLYQHKYGIYSGLHMAAGHLYQMRKE